MPQDLLVFVLQVFIVAFVAVMLAAARRRSLDTVKIDLRDGEAELRKLEVQKWFSRRRLTLTTHRVILQRVHWALATTSKAVIPLEELDGCSLVHRMNLWALVLGLVVFALLAPLGLILVLVALVATQYTLTLGSRNHKLRFSMRGKAGDAVAAYGFLRHAGRQHVLVARDQTGMSDLLQPAPPPAAQVIPQLAWFGVLVMMFLAAVQRGFQGGVDLNTAPFLALYCAIPALVGTWTHGRSGFVCGFFGMFGVLSILYPMPWLGFFSVGSAAPGSAYLAAAVAAGAVGGLAGLGRGKPFAAIVTAAGCLLWFAVPWLASAACAGTLSSVATITFAAGIAAIMTAIPEPTSEALTSDDAPMPFELEDIEEEIEMEPITE